MPSQFGSGQVKIRTATLIFVKGSAAPIVLYVDNPLAFYEELQGLMKTSTAKLIEKDSTGPIKKVSVMSNQISAVALQDEQYI